MSRTSLHRPRRNRAVWHRTASGTRLFTCPFPPTVPLHISHYKRCPRAHRLRLRSDQSLSPPVHVTGYGRFPDKKRHALSKGPCQVRAALTRRTTLALSATPTSTASSCSPGPSCPETPPSLPSERPCHTATAESPRPHISVWPGTSGGRDCPTPRFSRVSFTSSQKHGAVAEPAPMWNIRCGGQHPSVQASPPSCATVRDLPSPPPPVPSFPPLYSILPAPEPESIPFCRSTWAVASPPTGSVNPFPPT